MLHLNIIGHIYVCRWCKKNEETVKADALVSDLLNADVIKILKKCNKRFINKLLLANTVGGATNDNNIADM